MTDTEANGNSSALTQFVETMGDVLGSLDGIPPPIKRNLFKAAGSLIIGVADVPAAYFEMKAAEFRAKKHGHETVMAAAARNAATIAGKSPEIADRALAYFANDLVREQANREAIIKEAVVAVGSSSPQADEVPPINDDWLHQFRKLASSKSNAEVQAILGKILAGEIHQPGSFSPFTLEVLSRLDNYTAKCFEYLATRAIIVDGDVDFVVMSILGEDGVHRDALISGNAHTVHLMSCGLVQTIGMGQINPQGLLHISHATIGGQKVNFNGLEVESARRLMMPMTGDTLYLTQAGDQLQSIIPKTFDAPYARLLRAGLRRLGVEMSFSDIDIDNV